MDEFFLTLFYCPGPAHISRGSTSLPHSFLYGLPFWDRKCFKEISGGFFHILLPPGLTAPFLFGGDPKPHVEHSSSVLCPWDDFLTPPDYFSQGPRMGVLGTRATRWSNFIIGKQYPRIAKNLILKKTFLKPLRIYRRCPIVLVITVSFFLFSRNTEYCGSLEPGFSVSWCSKARYAI